MLYIWHISNTKVRNAFGGLVSYKEIKESNLENIWYSYWLALFAMRQLKKKFNLKYVYSNFPEIPPSPFCQNHLFAFSEFKFYVEKEPQFIHLFGIFFKSHTIFTVVYTTLQSIGIYKRYTLSIALCEPNRIIIYLWTEIYMELEKNFTLCKYNSQIMYRTSLSLNKFPSISQFQSWKGLFLLVKLI